MNTPSYDIDAVRQYFFYYTYEYETRSMNQEEYERYTKKPYFLLSEKIGGMLIATLGSILFFVFLLSSWKDFITAWSIWWSKEIYLLYFFAFLGFMLTLSLWNQMFHRAKNFESLTTYFEKKADCISALRALEQAIEIDRENTWIDPIHIAQIHSSVRDIEQLSKLLYWPLSRFKKLDSELEPRQKHVMEQFLTIECQSVMEYISTFQWLLKEWITIHSEELQREEIALREKNNKIFYSSITRLAMQSEALEKIKVSL